MTTATVVQDYEASLTRETIQSRISPSKLTPLITDRTLYTDATQTLDKIAQEPNLVQLTETVLSEVRGVILAVEDEYVKVKIGVGTVVNFPKILFQDKPFASLGQHVRYQIKRDARGYRYQDFVQDAAQPDPDLKQKIRELLGEY